jgi:hypothetical protein
MPSRKSDKSALPPILEPPTPLATGSSDQDKLDWILETIRAVLYDLVHSTKHQLLPANDAAPFAKVWPEVVRSIDEAIQKLKAFNDYATQLKDAGMTDGMLELKVKSLERCVDGLYREMNTTPPLMRSIYKYLKPATKCMNSILGSLKFLGLEIPKEFKDHFEVALDLADAD